MRIKFRNFIKLLDKVDQSYQINYYPKLDAFHITYIVNSYVYSLMFTKKLFSYRANLNNLKREQLVKPHKTLNENFLERM